MRPYQRNKIFCVGTHHRCVRSVWPCNCYCAVVRGHLGCRSSATGMVARRSRARKGADGGIPAEKPGQHDPPRRAVDCAPYLTLYASAVKDWRRSFWSAVLQHRFRFDGFTTSAPSRVWCMPSGALRPAPTKAASFDAGFVAPPESRAPTHSFCSGVLRTPSVFRQHACSKTAPQMWEDETWRSQTAATESRISITNPLRLSVSAVKNSTRGFRRSRKCQIGATKRNS
jgi:hypothetical protein